MNKIVFARSRKSSEADVALQQPFFRGRNNGVSKRVFDPTGMKVSCLLYVFHFRFVQYQPTPW